MAKFQNLFAWAVLIIISTLLVHAMGDDAWEDGAATFYGDMSGGETMQGACGYGDLFQQGYGLDTAALSTALFNNGLTCGACFEIMCVNDPQWCIPNAGTIKITATNFCPPNYDPHFYPWCNPPRKHFDLAMPMFVKLAIAKAGIIPVKFRRVPCAKTGGVRFELKGNPYWITATILNVGGAGDVTAVKIKGSNSDWLQMQRNWGQVWQIGVNLVGQGLSFQVTTSDGKTVELDNIAPGNWQFGQTYEGKSNF
ncbi:expansin-A23 [Rosa sericea]